ncbi:Protocatechuate 3,4-dioxygenase beta chain [Anatilimnocola aggregata]|uniref:Protocatechuate 3,4-dioxygenase beta chain n=1 Tax=Anatilimnocola aggregata TaxID=2528021 RepID=A0A517YI58_9BACT|nr:protocatechuate 3,4-dioxygenase [Anatilimnocola aggregata]QDU29908.1 Protocatechuate 3,4-dioxygenase beta chain [Anatilimnocola aggregata]
MLRSSFSRRNFLAQSAFTAAMFTTPGLYAEMLSQTPAMTEGPFYPDKLPLDTDNDLLLLNDAITPAVGEVTHLTGKILDLNGEPIVNAFVEIWQVDHHGAYLHAGTSNADKRDKNFQGYGRFLTNSKGEYYFRTIKPVPYPGRTPHIHVGISRNGKRVLTTQLFVDGHPGNERDGILRNLGDQAKSVLVPFQPVKNSKIGELAANFDVVLGKNAEDPAPGTVQAGVAKAGGMRGGPGGGGRGPGGRGPGGPGGPGPAGEGPPRRP